MQLKQSRPGGGAGTSVDPPFSPNFGLVLPRRSTETPQQGLSKVSLHCALLKV